MKKICTLLSAIFFLFTGTAFALDFPDTEVGEMVGVNHPFAAAIKGYEHTVEIPLSNGQPGFKGDLKKLEILFSLRVIIDGKLFQYKNAKMDKYSIETDVEGRKFIKATFTLPAEFQESGLTLGRMRIYPINTDYPEGKEGYYLHIIPKDKHTRKDDAKNIAYEYVFQAGKDEAYLVPSTTKDWVNELKVK